ncbi:amino acid adenylation domain-containing protein [Lysobacter sp. 5GHs7-4]|uniref:non-ribosomal peptide synthetase n=1 Tax=Lysobacter sp. 5GHs7-4 TaxID=2904253 RepID=UPI001E5835F4|nr:non-ribosomal peptide synthetase [Lysobacter sp. 5GHs7-4]UHQ23604.1 amino acid adenylation domain-containing protein [Lysobacter sp. 5GHs7-4]
MAELNQRLAGLSPEKRALLLQQLAKQSPAAPRSEIGRRARPARIPLSYAQQRLWILDQLDPGSAAYNVPTTMWLQGPLDEAAFARALDEIQRRHEVLRTTIASDEQGPQQVVQPPSPVPIDRQDVRALPASEREAAAFAHARAEAARAFDLARGPLLRALLVRVDDDRHLFTLNAHHIAVDGWSLGLLNQELRQLYGAYHAGQPSPLAELPVQYVDYALWQRELMEGPTLQAQLAYWRQRLAGPLPVLELPGDRPRPPVQSYGGDVLRSTLAPSTWEGIKRLSRQEGATPFMAVLAAYQTLLMRYSGQHDLVVGVGVANRRREELESLAGFFVNTLALRNDLSGNPRFRELLAQVKDSTLGAYSHQDLPAERLIEDLQPERSLSHAPLFQAMLFFQNFPNDEVDLAGLTLAPVDFDQINPGTARSDLALFASEQDGSLALFLEYASDLFDAATVEAFSAHFQQLLASIAQDPDARLGELDILDPAQRQRLIAEWNATDLDVPLNLPLHRLFEQQAQRRPDAIAVECGPQRLSYAELDAQADALARALAARGAGPGDLVGLFVERSPRMLVGLLGILKAGAAYVPMDPSYPAERLGYMLEDARARWIVSERGLQSQLPASDCELLWLDELDAAPGTRVDSGVGPEDLAYVIFTSGSTGRPKGVQIPHRAVVNFLAAVAREPGLSERDTMCAVTTLSFDIAVLELLLPLQVGARIVLADRATAADGAALARLLDHSGATVMQATPATWRMLLDAGWAGRAQLRMLCGGEALARELATRLLPCGAELWNLYGPTETTVWSAVERVGAGDAAITIGRPLANTQLHIVDARGQLVPVGVPGELLIGGLGVARGYLARPDLTAEKFVPDRYGPNRGARLYRTGDLARRLRDGRIEVLGRIDHQVKLRGFRIELGEIESVLADHPQVRQAVVICREDRPGDKRLVAYTLGEADAAQLRAHARQRLPEYMLPSAYVSLAQYPLTPNGKVDRKALPAPDADALEARAYVAPRNGEEETLARLWAEVLGLERVGIHDDFFDLGGHSLLATQLITRAQKAFGGEIALRTLFEAPTVAGFAELLLRQRMDGVDADALAGMLDQLEGLSDEDIQLLLAGEGAES